jgi:glycosyltransferase involved in cell wall biosynthesis
MILLIGHEASLTGAPKVLLAFSHWLKFIKNEKIEIILKSGGPLLEQYQKVAPVYIWEQDYRPKNLFLSAWDKISGNHGYKRKQYLRSLKNKGIQIIFCNTIVNGDILESLRFLNVPVISRIPELEMVIKQYNKTGLADKTFKYTDYFIAVSGSVKENLVKNHSINAGKIHVIHNGLLENPGPGSEQKTRSSLNIPENAFVIGACGTLLWRKGIDLFIRLALELITKHKRTDILFTWVGGDVSGQTYRQYTEEIKKLALDKFIAITGETQNPYDYYQIMDVFCMVSREEPFGLVMLEAGICGLPVLSFAQSGYPEEFTTPDVGFVLPYADVEKMAEKIIYLKDHPELREIMSGNIRKKSAEFSFENMANQIYSLIKGTSQRVSKEVLLHE